MCAHALVSLGIAAAPSTAVDATAQEKESPAALLGKAKVHCRFCVAGLCTCASLNLRCMCVRAHACWSACLWVCGGGGRYAWGHSADLDFVVRSDEEVDDLR